VVVFGFREMDDCWFVIGVEDVMEIQCGVVHSPCVKCHGVDVWVCIGCGVVFLVGWCWGSISVCVGRLLSVGGCVHSGEELV
jgi:hypothetical protein